MPGFFENSLLMYVQVLSRYWFVWFIQGPEFLEKKSSHFSTSEDFLRGKGGGGGWVRRLDVKSRDKLPGARCVLKEHFQLYVPLKPVNVVLEVLQWVLML